MKGTEKQIKWAIDIKEVVLEREETFKKYLKFTTEKEARSEEEQLVKEQTIECLEDLLQGVEIFNAIEDAGQIINLGRNFKAVDFYLKDDRKPASKWNIGRDYYTDVDAINRAMYELAGKDDRERLERSLIIASRIYSYSLKNK